MNVWIRVEGNSIIGMGHVSRCLILAKEFRNQGINVSFIINNESASSTISYYEFETFRSNDRMSGNNYFVNEFEDVNIPKPDLVIVDHYEATQNTFDAYYDLGSQVAYIDDLYRDVFHVDILIHGSLAWDFKMYDVTNTYRMIGLEYVLLNTKFCNMDYRVVDVVKNVLITTGATNPNGIAYELTKFLSNIFNGIDFHLVVGPYFDKSAVVYEELQRSKNICLYNDLTDLSTLMIKCDVAISAGGVTIYELLAIGVPVIGLILAENQKKVMHQLKNRKYLDIVECKENFHEIKLLLDKMIKGFEYRVNLSNKGRSTIDGLGANRIVSEIIKIVE